VKATVETWPYEVKSGLFERYVRQQPEGKALAAATYEWDVLLALTVLTELPETIRANTMLQQITPRYGYDVPAEVEEAGLSNDYDDIFDQSLALHSTLQARGFTDEAQYATLLGHKQRWSLMTQPNDLRSTPKDSALAVPLLQRLHESHPLLWGKLD
jgi:hypothetical protein